MEETSDGKIRMDGIKTSKGQSPLNENLYNVRLLI